MITARSRSQSIFSVNFDDGGELMVKGENATVLDIESAVKLVAVRVHGAVSLVPISSANLLGLYSQVSWATSRALPVLSVAILFQRKKEKGDPVEVSSPKALSRSTAKLLKDDGNSKDKKGRPASKKGKATASVEATVVTVSPLQRHTIHCFLVYRMLSFSPSAICSDL